MSATADVEVFEAERPRLFGLAYRMLGVHADADDVVQEAWLRFQGADDVDRPAVWLTTVTSRIAIDRLRSAQRRRETYVGPWLPEPIVTDPTSGGLGSSMYLGAPGSDPAAVVELSESLTLGFLTVLDRLEPVDRAVFLLRDVFDVPYREVAAVVDKSEDNCRQIAHRARRRVHEERPHVDLTPDHRSELLDAFLDAVTSGDPGRLEPMLAADVVHVSDGGPERRAARVPVRGRERVARLLTNLAGRMPIGDLQIDHVDVNGQPGLVVSLGEPIIILELEYEDALISRVHAVLNPEKLAAAIDRLR